MASGKLRYEYNTMSGLASAFSTEGHDITQLYSHLKNQTDHLHGAGWVGLASDKWFGDQENILLPKTQQLGKILEEIGTLIKQLSSLFQGAEQESAGLFKQKS